MQQQENEYLKQLLDTENVQLQKLHDIVADAVREEELLTSKLTESAVEKTTFGMRLADQVAAFGGSWMFIITFGAIILIWISINALQLVNAPFDPYPFILLNLVLSCLAALQAPVIMMSQNRQEQKDRQRAENDYLINLKAEIEIRNLHQKIDLLMAEQLKNLMEIQKIQIELLEKLNRQMGGDAESARFED